MKDIKDKEKKDNIEINYEARDTLNNTSTELTVAVVCRATIKQIDMLDNFLEANRIKVRYRTVYPGYLKIVTEEQ